MIEFRNLQVVYDDAIEAVRDVSLQAEKGALVALLGYVIWEIAKYNRKR